MHERESWLPRMPPGNHEKPDTNADAAKKHFSVRAHCPPKNFRNERSDFAQGSDEALRAIDKSDPRCT